MLTYYTPSNKVRVYIIYTNIVNLSVCWSVCMSVRPNPVTRSTSALPHALRWSFAYSFAMRCSCACHNFHTRHSTNYGVIAPFSTLKILWRWTTSISLLRLTYHFTYTFVVRFRCAWNNFHMRHSTIYGVIAPNSTSKILWRDLFLLMLE